ncbi:DUF1304 domain-containing protein [Microbacterium sp. Yaish 1]|uniref:DUF1304 domain-containing protein n=1 Tax=Microbacterium sp. Yaish 1 TaxID=2025014 RepID=UPI000B940838|nr:DUF1304 domain-containing protein [Microbacterium sp. Yaish 1]OYC97172.1 hypothetical protein CI089_01040 [Microbacterium sp. Yaish 1]
MIIAGLALAGLAALIHVFIFYLESIAWTSERARKTFGTGTTAQAEAQKALAFNQGFYNLFLAITVFIGITFVVAGNLPVGAALVFAGAGSMVAASLVLILSDSSKSAAALKQGVVPALGVLALALGIAL